MVSYSGKETGKLCEVLLHKLANFWKAHRSGRVEGDEDSAAVNLEGLAVDCADAEVWPEGLEANLAKTDDQAGSDGGKLGKEPEAAAGGDLVCSRRPITRWPTLDRSGDEDLGPGKANPGKEGIEQASRRADEGTTALILFPARRLTDEENLGLDRPFTRHGMGSRVGKATGRADPDAGGEPLKFSPGRSLRQFLWGRGHQLAHLSEVSSEQLERKV